MKFQRQIKKKNMTTSKATPIISQQLQQPAECCMCGDCGFSHDLFQCKLCQFRSQHRYCSNLYPNVADSNRSICNWCLTQKDDAKEKSQNSSNSDSITKINITNPKNNKQQQGISSSNNNNNNTTTSLIARRQGSNNHLQVVKYGPIKKQKSVEVLIPSPAPAPAPSPSPVTRKRILLKEERLRRTRSEDISNGKAGVTKHVVFRNKVRRYKLLDEVSS